MKSNFRRVASGLCMLFLHASLFAQTIDWKTEKTDDGMTVKNRISNRTDAQGKEQQLVEYIVTTTTTASITKLISTMKDVTKHKEFMGQKTSINVKTLSEHECIVYYFYGGFWPYPSSDIVAKMIFNGDAVKKVTTFTWTAAPSLVEDKGVRRLDYYNLTYSFHALENGNVEITIVSKFTPAVQLPVFMMNSWFPDGPADYLNGLIKIANGNE